VKDVYVMSKVKIALIMPECFFDETGCTIICKGGRRLITDANNRALVKTRLVSKLYRGTCQFISSARKPKPFRDDDSGIRCSSNKCGIRHHHRHPEGEELDPDHHYEEIAAAAPRPKPSATSTCYPSSYSIDTDKDGQDGQQAGDASLFFADDLVTEQEAAIDMAHTGNSFEKLAHTLRSIVATSDTSQR
jgi:hypothetical protein